MWGIIKLISPVFEFKLLASALQSRPRHDRESAATPVTTHDDSAASDAAAGRMRFADFPLRREHRTDE
jgi:hypothetical protein